MYNTTNRIVLNTEFCGDTDLQTHLTSYNNMLRPSAVKEIIISLARALAYLHSQHIYHRDIKLENVLINDEGVIKLIDFGFALLHTEPNVPILSYCGTPAYMSPEIVKRRPYDGAKADMWALGVLVYKIVCGCFPFVGAGDQDLFHAIVNKQPKISTSVPSGLRALVLRLLEKNPAHRPTAEEVLSDVWLRINQ